MDTTAIGIIPPFVLPPHGSWDGDILNAKGRTRRTNAVRVFCKDELPRKGAAIHFAEVVYHDRKKNASVKAPVFQILSAFCPHGGNGCKTTGF